MSASYQIECDCGAVKIAMTGEPHVRGYCHCNDCRDLLKIPYHSVTAWKSPQVELQDGADALVEFQHPTKRMKRVYCSQCGETLYNTNAMDWRVISQLLIRKCNDGELPTELASTSHFFYASRIVDILDELPKRD